MCIRVHASGQFGHVSVYVCLMRGEYDSRLVWPFRGDITIQLVNHNNDRDHHEGTVPFDNTTVAGERVTSEERATGQGFYQFISHTVVESSTRTRRYIDNDCLTFRVTKVVVRSV